MKNLLLALTLALGLEGAAAGIANAQSFEAGKPVMTRIYICDSVLDVAAIVGDWTEQGWAGFIAARDRLNEMQNEQGQPVCGNYRGPMMPIEQVSTHSVLMENGETIIVYVLRIAVPGGGEFAALSTVSIGAPEIQGQAI